MADAAATPLEQNERDEQQAVYEWMTSLGTEGAIRVKLKRLWPKQVRHKGRMVQTSGFLKPDYEEVIDEERIFADHGGGKFQIWVQTLSNKGKGGAPKYVYAGSRTFEIAGDPNLKSLLIEDDDEASERSRYEASDGPVSQAMSLAHTMSREAQERADRLEEQMRSQGGTDWQMIEAVMQPLRDQLQALAQENASLQQQLFSKLGEKPDTSGQDRLLSIMENKEVGFGNSLESIRIQHQSELSQLREFNREEIKRREARFEKELDHAREGMKQQVASLERANQQALDSQRLGYEMRIKSLEDMLAQARSDAASLKVELGEVRGRKELTPLQSIQGLVELKNGFEALVPSGGGEPERSGWERALDTVMGSPLLEGIAARVAGAGAVEEEQPQQEQMVAIRRKDGQIVHVPASYVAQAQAAAAQRQAEANGETPAQPAPPQIDAADVQKAILFMEAAFRNGTSPEIFAKSARNMVPGDILAYIKQQGVDHFLNGVAKLEDGSPLATVVGRTWVRKVAKFLLEGTTDGISEEEPASPMES